MADYYMDLSMEQDAEFEAERMERQKHVERMEKQYAFGVLKWKTQNNGKILVANMTKEHLENSIAFVKRTMDSGEVSQKWIELLGYELEKRK